MRYLPVTRRSAFLILFGSAYVIIGLPYLGSEPHDSLRAISQVVPVWVIGALWIGCGLVAIVTGFTRWHKIAGFGALVMMASLWACISVISWRVGDSDDGLLNAVWIAFLAAGIHLVAGMVDKS